MFEQGLLKLLNYGEDLEESRALHLAQNGRVNIVAGTKHCRSQLACIGIVDNEAVEPPRSGRFRTPGSSPERSDGDRSSGSTASFFPERSEGKNQRVVHAMIVVSMNERRLLIAIGRVVCAVKVKKYDPLGFLFLLALHIPINKQLGHPIQV